MKRTLHHLGRKLLLEGESPRWECWLDGTRRAPVPVEWHKDIVARLFHEGFALLRWAANPLKVRVAQQFL